jgi:hypothetical protein
MTIYYRVFALLFLMVLMCSTTYAGRGGFGGGGRDFGGGGRDFGGGGFHGNNDINIHNNDFHGNYYPNHGYIAPGVVVTVPTDESDCQTIQQCDADGNCVETSNCD